MEVILFLVGASLLALVAGGLEMIRRGGRVERRTGAEIGEEMVAQRQDTERQPGELSWSGTTFRGKGAAVEGEASIGMAEFKALIRAGEWRRVAPSLFMIAGLLGVMLFGSLAVLFALEQKLTGILMLAVAIYATAKIAYDYIRS